MSEDRPVADGAIASFTPGRFALLLAVLIATSFSGVLFGGTTFIIRDFGLFSFPVAFFQRECFWRGEWPLWNPYSFCGVPFLAQWNTLALYPPSLIYLLLPLTWSLPFFCLVHLFWGGLGMYLLARAWTQNSLGAAVAGTIFAFNGLSLNFLMWPSHIATFSWLPWVLWLAPVAWREGGRKIVYAAIADALQMLAGGPETIAFTWLILFTLACGEWITRQAPRGAIALRFAALVFLVGLICAAQLLPFLELLLHSQRDSGFGSSEWAMPIWGWANFLAPLVRETPTSQGLYLQPGQYWTSSYYAGIGTLWLTAVAVRRVRNWRAFLMIALLAAGLMLALGDATPLYRGLRSVFPVLGVMRYPVKFVILILAVMPLLAALGVTAITERTWESTRFERMSFGMLLILVVALAGLDLTFPVENANPAVVFRYDLARAGFLALTFFLMWGLLSARRRRALIAGILAGVFWLDLLTHVPWQNPGVTPSVYAPGWASGQVKWQLAPRLGESRVMLAPFAREQLKHHMIASLEQNYLLCRLAFLADCNLLEHVPQVHGFFSLTPGEVNDAVALSYVQTNRDFPALMDFMGVSQVTAPGDPFAWVPRSTAMPIVTAGQRPIFADDQTAFAAFFQTNLDLRQIVFLPLEARGYISATQQTSARVLVSKFASQRIVCQSDAPGAGLIVIAQTYYAPWRAFVDGSPARIWHANYGFQALEVPAGRHVIELRYVDMAFLVGLWLSAAGLIVCGGLWFWNQRSPTPRPTQASGTN